MFPGGMLERKRLEQKSPLCGQLLEAMTLATWTFPQDTVDSMFAHSILGPLTGHAGQSDYY